MIERSTAGATVSLLPASRVSNNKRRLPITIQSLSSSLLSFPLPPSPPPSPLPRLSSSSLLLPHGTFLPLLTFFLFHSLTATLALSMASSVAGTMTATITEDATVIPRVMVK